MFDVFYIGKKPGLFPHEQPADSIEHAATKCRTRYFWIVTYLADYTGFDFLWEPVPWQANQRHAWASQWQKDSGTYLIPKQGYTDTNYHSSPIVTRLHSHSDWYTPENVQQFDYSWHPDPADPPYIYVFGTKYYEEGGPTYTVPGATNLKYVRTPQAVLTKSQNNWNELVTVADFDWSWRPHPKDPPFIYVFGNQWYTAEVMPTLEYHAPGATQRKYMAYPRAQLPERHDNHWHTVIDCEWDYSWVPDPGDPPYIYVFGNQWWPANKMATVEYCVPGATERKYMAYPRARLLPDRTNWTVPSGVDEESVDFSWVPDPGDPPYIYQFATQHQKTGGPRYTVPGASEIKYLEQLKIQTSGKATAIYEIDHMDGNAGHIPDTVRRVRYFDNYRDTLIRLAKSIGTEHEFVWVCSSVCDYTDFDFSWYPEDWQAGMLHVFASDREKFGDTFFMHVPSFAQRAERVELLEWYDLNFVDISVPRRPMPIIRHNCDSQVDAVLNNDFVGPLALFTNYDYAEPLATVPLWREKTKTIVPLSAGATSVIVPKVAIPYIKTQLYDYPHIDKTQAVLKSSPLDIVYISNGEYSAEQNYGHLLDSTFNKNNLVHRVENVKGRVAAYHAAARASTTPWFFAVFAKLEVSKEFPWDWQPDRMQRPKHYIFHALNPVNQLEYGHQAMIAYNRDLVLANTGQGLDFTLDSAHEVIPIRSGVAWYADTPWMAWRTAFREAIKLRASLPDVENEYRLNQWLTVDTSADYLNCEGTWSMLGAQDGVAYYEEVQGDFTALKKSYEWDWLASYAFLKRGLVPDQ